MKSLPLLACSFLLLLGISSFAPAQSYTECHSIKSPSDFTELPGYGSPFNVAVSPDELLIEVACAGNSATATVGNGDNGLYIYNKGYYYKNNFWQQVNLSGTNMVGSWIRSNASVDLAVNTSDLDTTNYFVAYTCKMVGGAWKCGCRDSACNNSYWQLQTFVPTSETAPPTGDDDNPGGDGTRGNPTAEEIQFGKDILADVNEYRSSQGLKMLEWNGFIAEVSHEHAFDTFDYDVPVHSGFYERLNRITQELGSYWGAEVQYQEDGLPFDLGGAIDGWLNSDVHKAILDRPQYDSAGVGVVIYDGGLFGKGYNAVMITTQKGY